MTRTDNRNAAISEFPQGISLPPVRPGRTIAAELAARGLSAHRAAMMMRVPPNRLGFIIAGKRGISADTALRLARLFGTSGQFWMNMQSQYDLALAARNHLSLISVSHTKGALQSTAPLISMSPSQGDIHQISSPCRGITR